MTKPLCYFRFFKYCENHNLTIKEHYGSARYTGLFIWDNNNNYQLLTIDGTDKYKNELFNIDNRSLISIIKKFNLDKNDIMKECERKKRDNEKPITEYEERYSHITTFHKHCS